MNGTRVHHRRAGAGSEAVVRLHGFPQTGRAREGLAARLADRFTIIAPGLRGSGDSQRPATGYDKRTMAADADIHELAVSLGFDGYRAFWQDADDNRRFAETRLTMPVLAIGAGLSVGTALAESVMAPATSYSGG